MREALKTGTLLRSHLEVLCLALDAGLCKARDGRQETGFEVGFDLVLGAGEEAIPGWTTLGPRTIG